MSPYQFVRRFQHSAGLPPHRLLVRQRIARARGVLATPEQSIAETSRLGAFRTPSHFTTVLRGLLGATRKPTAGGDARSPAPPRRRVKWIALRA